MLRRTHTNRSMAAAKLCVALVGMAAIPTWALAQQSTAKPEPTKPADAKAALAIDLGLPVVADKSATERELEALKAEMDSLNSRFKQLQADKAKQLAEQKFKLDSARQQAAKVEAQIQEAKKAEKIAVDAIIKDRLNAVADQAKDVAKDAAKIEGLKLQLGEFKVQTQQAIEKEKVAVDTAAKVAKTLTEWKIAQAAPAGVATDKAQTRQILRSGSQGVKVIGADGKEIPGVVVIIDKQIEVAAPPAKATTMTLTPGANGEMKGTLFLNPVPAQAPKIVEGKPLTAGTAKTIQVAPAAPAAPVAPAAPIKVEGIKIQVQPAPAAPAVPAAPKAPTTVEGVRLYTQPAAPAAPPQTTKPKSGATFTFDAVNLQSAAANTITLSRATYKLPKDQAATLATLLGGLKHIVMETKVDNDTLVVTTTPEAQKEIAGFVRLITGAVTKINFSVPLSATSSLLPALPTIQSAPAMPATAVVDFKANDRMGFFTVADVEAQKSIAQQFQIQQGKNGEVTIVGTTEKPKTEGKSIDIKATEKNGVVTVETVNVAGDKPNAVQIKKADQGERIVIGVAGNAKSDTKKIDVKATEKNDVFVVETVDVAGAKTKVLHIKKGENGEMIVIDASEGQGEAKGTIRLNGLSNIAPATSMKAVAPAAPIQIKVVAPSEAPKKAAPAAPAEQPK